MQPAIDAPVAVQANTNNGPEDSHRTWASFNFENTVRMTHEGLSGPPSRYRIRLRMDSSYRLADLKAVWKNQGGQHKLQLSASAKDNGKSVKANKSFEILVDPACQPESSASPTVTCHQDKEECWIEFPVAKLPQDLPLAQG